MIIKRKNFSSKEEDLKYRNTKVYISSGSTLKDAKKSIGKTIKDLDDEQLHKLADYENNNKEAIKYVIPIIPISAISGAAIGNLKGNTLKGAGIGAATGAALSIVGHKQRKKQAKAAKKGLKYRKNHRYHDN